MNDSLMHYLQALAVGIVEGLTEFLPISSTAHILLFGRLIQFDSGESKVFEIVIQLGAILAVCWIYRAKLATITLGLFKGERSAWLTTRNVTVAFLPAAIIGLLFSKYVKQIFAYPLIFSLTLFLGALVILWVERKPRLANNTIALDSLPLAKCLAIGLIQTIAMIPGTSRSGATIIGAMCLGIDRRTATEFSFFLAIPTMLGASTYDLYKHGSSLTSNEWISIAIGFIAAFISALLVVRGLIKFVAKHTFKVFAWYRIALSMVIAVVLLW